MRNILWAVRTKKRVEKLEEDYENWLGEIREVLNDTWWPLSFFDKYVNVKALEEDGNCRTAGFATSAGTRKLLLSDAEFEDNIIPGQIESLQAFDEFSRGVIPAQEVSCLGGRAVLWAGRGRVLGQCSRETIQASYGADETAKR